MINIRARLLRVTDTFELLVGLVSSRLSFCCCCFSSDRSTFDGEIDDLINEKRFIEKNIRYKRKENTH